MAARMAALLLAIALASGAARPTRTLGHRALPSLRGPQAADNALGSMLDFHKVLRELQASIDASEMNGIAVDAAFLDMSSGLVAEPAEPAEPADGEPADSPAASTGDVQANAGQGDVDSVDGASTVLPEKAAPPGETTVSGPMGPATGPEGDDEPIVDGTAGTGPTGARAVDGPQAEAGAAVVAAQAALAAATTPQEKAEAQAALQTAEAAVGATGTSVEVSNQVLEDGGTVILVGTILYGITADDMQANPRLADAFKSAVATSVDVDAEQITLEPIQPGDVAKPASAMAFQQYSVKLRDAEAGQAQNIATTLATQLATDEFIDLFKSETSQFGMPKRPDGTEVMSDMRMGKTSATVQVGGRADDDDGPAPDRAGTDGEKEAESEAEVPNGYEAIFITLAVDGLTKDSLRQRTWAMEAAVEGLLKDSSVNAECSVQWVRSGQGSTDHKCTPEPGDGEEEPKDGEPKSEADAAVEAEPADAAADASAEDPAAAASEPLEHEGGTSPTTVTQRLAARRGAAGDEERPRDSGVTTFLQLLGEEVSRERNTPAAAVKSEQFCPSLVRFRVLVSKLEAGKARGILEDSKSAYFEQWFRERSALQDGESATVSVDNTGEAVKDAAPTVRPSAAALLACAALALYGH